MSRASRRGSLRHRLAARLVRIIGWLVPRESRDRWVEEWQGEIWHAHAGSARRPDETGGRADSTGGAARDDARPPHAARPGRRRRREAAFPIRGIVADALAMRRVTRRSGDPGPAEPGGPERDGSGSGTHAGARLAARAGSALPGLQADLVQAGRVLRASPGFTAVAVVVFAAGVGAATAVFGVLDAVLWSPLDLPDAGRIVQVQQREVVGSATYTRTRLSIEAFRTFAAEARTLEGIAGLHDSGWENVFYLTGADEPERLGGALVTPGFFDVLGARAALGRVFTPEDAARGERIVVLAHGLWTRQFGADPEVIGSSIRLNGEPFQVVGILPASFELDAPAGGLLPDDEVELWAPVHVATGDLARRRLATGYDQVLARVNPSSSLAEAEAELDRLFSAGAGERAAAHRIRLVPVREHLVTPARDGLLLLAGIVGVVLLLVCLNVAGLQLARVAERQPELAVRAALGAGPGRLARQLAAEGLLVALGGGLVALVAARWATDLLASLAPASIPRLEGVTVEPLAYGFAMVLATAVGLLAALLPARAVSRSDPGARLRSGRTATSGRGPRRLRDALAVAQVAVATLLLIGGGLLARSFLALQRVDHGMRVDGIATLDVWVPSEPRAAGADAAVRSYFERVLEVARGTAGVVDAAVTSSVPFRPRDYVTPEWRRRIVSPGYFRVLDIPVRRGRTFTSVDRPGSPEVAVINETLARNRFGDGDPIGRRLEDDPDGGASAATGQAAVDPGPVVVGVVADTRHVGVDQPALPAAWVPHAQSPDTRMSLMVRTRGDPAAVLPALRTALWRIDPDQPLARPSTLEGLLAASAPMQARRFNLQVLTTCGSVAVLLALMGIHAVLARSVARRRREFGIRRALGAREAHVGALVLGRGFLLALAGVGLGALGGLATGRLLGSLLYDVEPADPLTYVVVAGVVLATSLLATWAPVRRALGADPVTVLSLE